MAESSKKTIGSKRKALLDFISMEYIQKIAKLLRTPEEVILKLEEKMNRITGKTEVLEKIYQKNQEMVEQKLKELKINPVRKNFLNEVKNSDAKIVYEALLKKAGKNDRALYNFFKKPKFHTTAGCKTLIDSVVKLTGEQEGFFLRLEKAKELLKLNPPQNILKFLKHKNIDELLAKENVLEIFSALRFAEDAHWLNDVFFGPYCDFKKEDFERRRIEVRVLPEKWLKIGSKFTGKKLHNISHLKELGIVFVIPFKGKFAGQTIELFTLVLHYFYEIDFYSKIFEKYAEDGNFGPKIISSLKGEVGGLPLPDARLMTWRIIQRYLAKDDPNDPRLLEPHINPEAVHWAKAEKAIEKLARQHPELDLNFWDGLDRVGEYFFMRNKNANDKIHSTSSGQVLISFDLIDNVISLSKKTTVLSKYLYHQQEALWNEIFIAYMGKEKTEQLLKDNLDKGYISLS